MATIALSCIYVAWFGQRAGKYAAGIILLSASTTFFVGNYYKEQASFHLIFAVDLFAFLALGFLAAHFGSKWLTFVAGLQLAKLATHLATIVNPGYQPVLYEAFLEIWTISIVACMALGQWLARRKSK